MKRSHRRIKIKLIFTAIVLGMFTTILSAWGNTFAWWDGNTTRAETEGIYTIYPGNLRFIETASEYGTTWYRSNSKEQWRYFRIGENIDNITFSQKQPLIFPPVWVTDRILHRYPVVTVCARGFPARAFVSVAYGRIFHSNQYGCIIYLLLSKDYTTESIDFTIGNTEFIFPTSVLWRGFLFNILFWSCIWYFALPRLPRPIKLIRARIEHKRTQLGLCPKCKYDLQYRQSTGCPECGWNHSKSGNEANLK